MRDWASMFSARVVRWSKWLVGVCFTLVMSVARSAHSATLDEALDALGSADRDQMEIAIAGLGGSGEPVALRVLKALDESQLRIDAAGQLLIKSEAGLVDARSGAPAVPTGSLREPAMNNRLRKNLSLA